jgi:hypothetical protein
MPRLAAKSPFPTAIREAQPGAEFACAGEGLNGEFGGRQRFVHHAISFALGKCAPFGASGSSWD